MSKYTIFCPKYTGFCPNCTENCPNSNDIFGNFDNLSPLKIQSLVCENECARIFLLPLLYPELFWKNYIFFQNLDRNTSGFHLLLTWGVQIWTETLVIWTSSLLDWSEWLLSSTPTIKMTSYQTTIHPPDVIWQNQVYSKIEGVKKIRPTGRNII